MKIKDCDKLEDVNEFIHFMLDCGLFDHQDMLEAVERAYEIGVRDAIEKYPAPMTQQPE